MAQPTEDEILRKARELCLDDGKIWGAEDPQNPLASAEADRRVADDADRADYLSRAKALLQASGGS